MKHEISCDMCLDLIPLVRDGAASEDSRAAVLAHIQTCPDCRAVYGGETPPEANSSGILLRIRRKLQLTILFVMMLTLLCGMAITNTEDQFYNALLMPLAGILGYAVYRWKALYQVPLMMLIIHTLVQVLGLVRGVQAMDMFSLLWWTAVCSIFSMLGTLMTGLFHFALRKEN